MKILKLSFCYTLIALIALSASISAEIQEVDTTSTRDVEKVGKSFSEKLIDVPGEILKSPFYITEYLSDKIISNPPMSIILPLVSFGQEARNYIPIAGYSSTKGIKVGFGIKKPGLFYYGDRIKFKWYYSTNNFQSYKLSYRTEKFLIDKTGFDFLFQYQKRPENRFYGIGPDSKIGNEANYSYESTNLNFKLPTIIFGNFNFDISGGYLLSNIYNGNNDVLEGDLDTLLGDPEYDLNDGHLNNSRYFHLGGAISFDARDNKGRPTRGSHLIAGFNRYIGYDISNHYDFNQYTLDFRHYQNIWFKRHFAVRIYIVKSDISNEGSQNLPFYLLNTLGGVDRLRGYKPGRFIDNDLALASIEYRYPIYRYLDAFLFLDNGRVYHDILNDKIWEKWKYSTGFGLRLWTLESVTAMFQVAVSEETTALYFDLGAEW